LETLQEGKGISQGSYDRMVNKEVGFPQQSMDYKKLWILGKALIPKKSVGDARKVHSKYKEEESALKIKGKLLAEKKNTKEKKKKTTQQKKTKEEKKKHTKKNQHPLIPCPVR